MSDAKNDLRVDRCNKIMTVSWLAPNIKQMRCFLDYGGADRDRTGDLLLAKQALSQLSYSPFRV
jgi:hypothetical protein